MIVVLGLTACAPQWQIPPIPPGLAEVNPGLAARVAESPHGLFRFVNRSFADAVCRAFAAGPGPIVNLHGDAHVEQYAITERGRGLTDFDDSARGPASVDLVRFSASLNLTCSANGYGCEPVLDSFWHAYTTELEQPQEPNAVPELVREARKRFVFDRQAVFREREALFEPLEDPARFDHLLFHYRRQMERILPELGSSFFETKRVGRLQIGVGSALDEKYLVRVEGETRSDDDDHFLEIKEVRDLSGIRCLSPMQRRSPLRVIQGQERLSYTPYDLAGYVVLEPLAPNTLPTAFWVHEWADNYIEVQHDALPTQRDLIELAFDVGIQLGLGHPRSWLPEEALRSRTELREWVARREPELRERARRMAVSLEREWYRRKRRAERDAKRVESRP